MRNRTTLLAAEIKAAGYGAMQDMNANKESDFVDVMNDIRSTDEFQQTMNLSQQKEQSRNSIAAEKNQLAKDKLQAQVTMKQMDVNIARENKNQFDIKNAQKNKDKNKKNK